MKKVLSSGFFVIAVGVLLYVLYLLLAPGCFTGIRYQIGTIADEFNISSPVAREVTEAAAQVWNQEFDESVITFDESSDFKITFVFDERQRQTLNRQNQESEIDWQSQKIAEMKNVLANSQARYESLNSKYQLAKARYVEKRDEYNSRVATDSNDPGLESEQKSLQDEFKRVENDRQAVNQLAEEINDQIAVLNENVRKFNSGIASFNQEYSDSDETFQQGVYNKQEGITIYQYENQPDLKALLVHEFGHALGLNHVSDPESVMYYLQHTDQAKNITLSKADRNEVDRVCNQGPFRTVVQNPLSELMQAFDLSILGLAV